MMIKRITAGVGALLTVAGLLIAVPWLLLQVGRTPTFRRWPTWTDIQILLGTPDDGSVILVVFTVIGWLAWAYLATGLLIEIGARLRRVPVPQLRGFGLSQVAARGLVGAIVVLFASMSLHAAPAFAEPVKAPTHAGAQAPADLTRPTEKNTTSAGSVRYTVKAGDTLAEIAQTRLGDADRWTDIYQASKHLNRPDGTRFSDPDLIQPGQQLNIPTTTKTTTGAVRYTVKAGDTLAEIAQIRLGDAERWTDIYQASKHLNRPDGTRFSDPDLIQPGQQLRIKPAPKTERDPAPAPRATPPTATPSQPPVVPPVTVTPSPAPTTSEVQATVQSSDDERSPMWSASLGVGSVLAGGVIGLVAWRRRLQHRSGPIGGHVPLPADHDALAEQQLRAAADPLAIETVDQALRGLARDCGAAGVPLPVVRAARLTATQFELYLAEPTQLPAPWTGTADGAVWRFEADHQPDVDVDELHSIPAPYPSLVTIGKDTEEEAGLIFVDLEYVGSLGITGGRTLTRQAIAALTIELASSPWADDLTVTLVGDYSELEGTLRSGRIMYVPTPDRLLDKLERRAVADRAAFVTAGVTDLQAARPAGVAPDATFPEIIMVATPLTARQRQRLTDLVSEMPRVAIAAVTTDDEPLGDWHIHLTGADQAVLEPIGLTITPQMLSGDAYDKVCAIIHMATHEQATVDDPPGLTVTAEALHRADDDLAGSDRDLTEGLGDRVDEAPTDTAAHAHADGALSIGEPAALQLDEPQSGDAPNDAAAAPAGEDQAHIDTAPTEGPVGPAPSDDSHPVNGDPVPPPVTDPPAVDAEEDVAAVREIIEQAAAAAVVAVGDERAPAPYIRVLGPSPDLDHARGEADITGRRDVSLEAIVYMALHPHASTASLDRALWPDSDNPSSTRAPALSRARRWLGSDTAGEPYLAHHTYRLSDQVTTDWARFQKLIAAGIDKTGTRALEEALALVEGRPFSGVRTQSRSPRYTWAEPVRQRMIEAITSVSHELAQRRQLIGDWLGVEAALVRGIEVEPALEHLWRLRIRAAVKRGDAAAVQEAITRMTSLAEKLGVEIDPETEELLKAIRHTKILEKTR